MPEETPDPAGDDPVRQLRAELALVAADAQAARTLAAGADRDVAEVRAELRSHTRVLTALRETQVEQGRAISDLRVEMRTRFTAVESEMRTRFTAVESEMRTRFTALEAEMRGGFATMAAAMADIVELVSRGTED
jgi:hypothetical protein